MAGFRHVGDESIADLARIKVVRSTFEAPDGSQFTRDVVRNQQVVAMVPLHPDGTVTLVRQYRGPIDAEILEIPAGLCDVEGEEPTTTAARELVEEVGLVADQLHLMANFHPAAGFCDQFVRLYLATGLTEVADSRQGPEEEHMTVERVALDDVPAMVADGRLVDGKTIIGLLAARQSVASPPTDS
ncbi:MAG: NUDIX hydrolase [Aquihabitans sp.]